MIRSLIVSLFLSGVALVASADEPKTSFPTELVSFRPIRANPVFKARGSGHWDVKIRERGWILLDGGTYKMWFTGYDGTRAGTKMLGYATSVDGVNWKRRDQPIYRGHWVEDVMVLKQDGQYYMFAEGSGDRAYLLTSVDGIRWTHRGSLDIRLKSGKPLPAGPYGTPTAWFENGTWYLFYERRDAGVWLATSKDMKVWTNVQDDPVLKPGPGHADGLMIALNQIVKHKGKYYAYYHGTGSKAKPRKWCTCLAVSGNLRQWTKYPQNPLQPVGENKSSGILVRGERGFRLYTMHDRVDLHLPK